MSSLPLSFSLLASLSTSTFSSPLACLEAHVPYRVARPPGEDAPPIVVRDLNAPTVTVVRILDPEHRETFISLARIFLACGLTPVEGLLRFSLNRPNYDSSLGGLAPFVDIWIPLADARRVCKELDVLDELAALLEWETRAAWSVEDKEEGGLIHNWRIGTDLIDPKRYSTEAMLSTTFPRIHLLPLNVQVRTLTSPTIPTPPFPPLSSFPTTFPALYSRLVEWTILEYESHLDNSPPPSPLPSSTPNLTLTSLSTSLLSLLSLLNLLAPDALPPNEPLGSALVLGNGRLRIERRDVGLGGGTARIALVDAVARLVGSAWRQDEERLGKLPRISISADGGSGDGKGRGKRRSKGKEKHEAEEKDRGLEGSNTVEERLGAIEAFLRGAPDLTQALTNRGEENEAEPRTLVDVLAELRSRVEEVAREQATTKEALAEERKARDRERAKVRAREEAEEIERRAVAASRRERAVLGVGTLNAVLIAAILVLLWPQLKTVL